MEPFGQELWKHQKLWSVTVGEKHRVGLPAECFAFLVQESKNLEPGAPARKLRCMLAQEQAGCLSLWSIPRWQKSIEARVRLAVGRLEISQAHLPKIQRLTRLYSARSEEVALDDKGRFVVTDGFRQFLNVEPGNDVIVVGTAVCVEIWNPQQWQAYLREDMGEFNGLLGELAS